MDISGLENKKENALKLLQDNSHEWVPRYNRYAKIMKQRLEYIGADRRQFNRRDNTFVYMSLVNAMSKRGAFALRFKGQKVGHLRVVNDNVYLSTSSCARPNKYYFGYDESFDNELWTGPVAQRFRAYFRNEWVKNHQTHNKESQIESLFISELECQDAKEAFLGTFWGIQPVMLSGGCRFQMKTPLRASRNTLEYMGPRGGGIDVLARYGIGAANALSVCELKTVDETGVQQTAEQGLSYAVFIRELLRTDSRDQWFQIFGYARGVPDRLNLNCIIVMGCKCESFDPVSVKIGNDVINMHYLYYDCISSEQGPRLKICKTSLVRR